MPLPPLLLKERPTAPTDACTDDQDQAARRDGQPLNQAPLDPPYEDDHSVVRELKPYMRRFIPTRYTFDWPKTAKHEHLCRLEFDVACFDGIEDIYNSSFAPHGWCDLATSLECDRCSSQDVVGRLIRRTPNPLPYLCVNIYEAELRRRAVGITLPAPAWATNHSAVVDKDMREGYLLRLKVGDKYPYDPTPGAPRKNNYWALNLPLFRNPVQNEVVHFEADHSKWRGGLCNPSRHAGRYGTEMRDGAKLNDQVARFLGASARIIREASAGVREAWLHDYAIVDNVGMPEIITAVREAVADAVIGWYQSHRMREEDAWDERIEKLDAVFQGAVEAGIRAVATKLCWRVKYYKDKLGAQFYTTDATLPDDRIVIHGSKDHKNYGVFPTRDLPYDECIQHVYLSIRTELIDKRTAASVWFAEWSATLLKELRLWNYRATMANVRNENPKWYKEGMPEFKPKLAMYEHGFEFMLDIMAQGERLRAVVGDPVVCTSRFDLYAY